MPEKTQEACYLRLLLAFHANLTIQPLKQGCGATWNLVQMLIMSGPAKKKSEGTVDEKTPEVDHFV